jgi:DNA-binding transcriptional MerR regulator
MLSEWRTYTIGEIANELNVSVGWLRIGERLGALPLARRTPAGWRYYTSEDLERLRRLGVGQRKRELEERARERA